MVLSTRTKSQSLLSLSSSYSGLNHQQTCRGCTKCMFHKIPRRKGEKPYPESKTVAGTTAMTTSSTLSTSSALRRSCIFCRARKTRCSGGHVCRACRDRNINCVYGLEARKGRPRNVRKGVAATGLSLEGSGRKHDNAPTPRQGQVLGGELEQMFGEYFIRKSSSRSNLFQNSIASFQRHAQQQQQ